MKMNASTRIILGIVSSLAASTAAFIALAYVRSGRLGQPSPLLPTPVEQKLDQLTSWLEARVGRVWVERGMEALQTALRGTGPDRLVQLLERVIEAEAQAHPDNADSRLDDKPEGNEPLPHTALPVGEN